MSKVEQSTLEESGKEILSLIRGVLWELGPGWKIKESHVHHYTWSTQVSVTLQRPVEGSVHEDALSLSFWRVVRK